MYQLNYFLIPRHNKQNIECYNCTFFLYYPPCKSQARIVRLVSIIPVIDNYHYQVL